MSETTTKTPPACPECGEPMKPIRSSGRLVGLGCLSCRTTRPLGWTGDAQARLDGPWPTTDAELDRIYTQPPAAPAALDAPTADGEAAVQVGTAEAYPRVGVTVRGWAWLGLLRIRIYLDDGDWRTFWHVALWKFMFGVALPAAWVNTATTKAKVSDGK